MEAVVDVPVVPVVPFVVVPVPVSVEVDAVVLAVLGVLMLLRGAKLIGMFKLLRAAPKVRVISLET